MNTLNKLTLNCALFAFSIIGLAVSTQAQSALGTNHSLQEAMQESPSVK
jgi:hypothetical protein